MLELQDAAVGTLGYGLTILWLLDPAHQLSKLHISTGRCMEESPFIFYPLFLLERSPYISYFLTDFNFLFRRVGPLFVVLGAVLFAIAILHARTLLTQFRK